MRREMRSSRIVWTFLLMFLPLAGVLYSTPAGSDSPSFFELPEDLIAGGDLFMKRGCVSCHAIQGLGGVGGPDLGRTRSEWSFLDIAAAMWSHSPKMEEGFTRQGIKRPQLTSDEMFQLIAFVYFLSSLGDPGDPARGELTFVRNRCNVCHSVGDEGPPGGIPLDRFRSHRSPAFIAASVWNAHAKMAEAMQDRGIRSPTFEGSDLADLIAFIRREADPGYQEREIYLAPGSPKRGSMLFSQKGCRSCHAIRGEGGREGPDLGRPGSPYTISEMLGSMLNHSSRVFAAVGEMGSKANLSAEDTSDIMAYVSFSRFVDLPGDADRGRDIFIDRECATCHALSPEESSVGLNVSEMEIANAAAVAAAMWNHASEMEEATRVIDVAWPQLRPGEMTHVVAFIRAAGKKKAAE